jgi:hypothetical protein
MLSGILSRRDSMAETFERLKGMSGKLFHIHYKKYQPIVRQEMD